MDNHRVRLDLSYRGSDFCGWQIQKKGRTVQGEIEAALEKLHGHPIRLTGAGRTDAGVHARFQTAHFDSDRASISDRQMSKALNSLLPDDIHIYRAVSVAPDFHARFDAVERGYRYFLLPSQKGTPFQRGEALPTKRNHNVSLLNRYCSFLIGQHDFTAFASIKDASQSKVRVISSASFVPDGHFLVFRICGNAFLWKMVRSIVGTLLDLEKENAPASEVQQILQSKDRSRCGTTAPAYPLFLDFVRYPGEAGGTGFEYEKGIAALGGAE